MEITLQNKVLNLLLLHGEGLSAPQLLAMLRPRISQPTLRRRRYHDRWHELLQGPLVEVVRAMTESSEMADVLRKESPLSAFVSPDERRRIFDSTRAG